MRKSCFFFSVAGKYEDVGELWQARIEAVNKITRNLARKVPFIVTLYSKYSRALTLQSLFFQEAGDDMGDSPS